MPGAGMAEAMNRPYVPWDDSTLDRGRRPVGADGTTAPTLAGTVAGGPNRQVAGCARRAFRTWRIRASPWVPPPVRGSGSWRTCRWRPGQPLGPASSGRRHRALPAEPNAAEGLDRSHGRAGGPPRPRGGGGGAPGPSPVGLRKPGSRHRPSRDGKGAPLHVVTTSAHVDDATRTWTSSTVPPPVAGRPARPRRRPAPVLGGEAYDPRAVRRAQRGRRTVPVISRKGPRTSRCEAHSATSSSRPRPCSTGSKPRRRTAAPPRTPRRLPLVARRSGCGRPLEKAGSHDRVTRSCRHRAPGGQPARLNRPPAEA